MLIIYAKFLSKTMQHYFWIPFFFFVVKSQIFGQFWETLQMEATKIGFSLPREKQHCKIYASQQQLVCLKPINPLKFLWVLAWLIAKACLKLDFGCFFSWLMHGAENLIFEYASAGSFNRMALIFWSKF